MTIITLAWQPRLTDWPWEPGFDSTQPTVANGSQNGNQMVMRSGHKFSCSLMVSLVYCFSSMLVLDTKICTYIIYTLLARGLGPPSN